MQAIEKRRIEFIDLAKGICIFMVVLVHVMPDFGDRFKVLACLRMPLYFCLSGLFYKDYGGIKNFTIKKVNNILIPFVAWYLIGYGIYYVGRIFLPSGNEATYHFSDILFQNDIFNIPIWFLLCLFWSNVLFSIVSYIAKKWYTQLLGVMLIAGGGLLANRLGIFNFLYFFSSMTCLPFFYLGYALKKTTLLHTTTNKKLDFILMAVCLGVASIFAFLPPEPPRLHYYRNLIISGDIFSIYICAALLVVGILILCKFVKTLPFLSWLGRYSIIVLVTHMWLRDILGTLLNKFAGQELSEEIKPWIILLLVLGAMGLVIPFCKKYLPYITAQKPLIKIKETIEKKTTFKNNNENNESDFSNHNRSSFFPKGEG